MQRKIHPVEAALMDYRDHDRIMPKSISTFNPDLSMFGIPDVTTEVAQMFDELYDQSRQFVQQPDHEETSRLYDDSLHDALNEGVEPTLARKEVRGSYHGMSLIDAEDPHLLTDEARRHIQYLGALTD
jgi:hypothetical protein